MTNWKCPWCKHTTERLFGPESVNVKCQVCGRRMDTPKPYGEMKKDLASIQFLASTESIDVSTLKPFGEMKDGNGCTHGYMINGVCDGCGKTFGNTRKPSYVISLENENTRLKANSKRINKTYDLLLADYRESASTVHDLRAERVKLRKIIELLQHPSRESMNDMCKQEIDSLQERLTDQCAADVELKKDITYQVKENDTLRATVEQQGEELMHAPYSRAAKQEIDELKSEIERLANSKTQYVFQASAEFDRLNKKCNANATTLIERDAQIDKLKKQIEILKSMNASDAYRADLTTVENNLKDAKAARTAEKKEMLYQMNLKVDSMKSYLKWAEGDEPC